jgi:anti-sigma factor RsiW
MGCRSIHKKLPQYVQGLLSAADARRIDDHLLACAACRDELASLRKIWNALDSLPAPAAAPSMAPEVLLRIDDYERKRSGPFRSWLAALKPSFAGAAAAIMLAGFVSGAFLSSAYYPENGQAQADTDSAYAEILSDAPPASFFDMYLQSAGQNSQENAL